jgi:hypothetical protein
VAKALKREYNLNIVKGKKGKIFLLQAMEAHRVARG